MSPRFKKIKIGRRGQKRRLWFLLTVLFLLMPFGLMAGYQEIFADKIYLGVKINGLNLGGKTAEEALDLLKPFSQKIEKEGLVFTAQNKKGETKEVKVETALIAPDDPDLSRVILSFDLEQTVRMAFLIGRDGNWLENLKAQWQILSKGRGIDLKFYLNEDEFQKILASEYESLEEPPLDAQLKITAEHQIEITSEQIGYGFDYQKAVRELAQNLRQLIYQPIRLAIVEKFPQIKKEDTDEAVQEAYQILNLTPVSLKYNGQKKSLSRDDLGLWLEFKAITASVDPESNAGEKKITVGFNQEKTANYLKELSEKVDIEPIDAKFKMAENKVAEFHPGKNGLRLDLEENYKILGQKIINERENELELKMAAVEPKIAIKDINGLGIKELIGTGESNFAGSPKNRRHNIKVGAEKLNGVLIKPGEKFSLTGTLGKINEEAGYLPELVIKKGKTIPEYGGGLCQIGTTAFRVALNAGLPVTERQAHSYRVVYYEPAGMDATIYNPSPDLKFINDTGAHILFLTKIEKDKLIFEFWGTADGRQAEIGKPEISNIVKPGPAKYIETDELKPGEKKRIETSHNGADAQFTSKVTYPDGAVKEKIWKSHYVPWKEVWLIGKKPEEKKAENPPATAEKDEAGE